MNFDMASEMLELDGIETRTVLGTDDIASATVEERHKRRGVAGIIYAYKIAGAHAEAGADLAEVARIAQKSVNANWPRPASSTLQFRRRGALDPVLRAMLRDRAGTAPPRTRKRAGRR
jgi:dihydroxyacetone kinase